ncbi:MAG: heme-binding domain-containing protein [Lutibacter sp.]|nr:heme-binding domain-containing protein [Lutibacter sp.]MDP3946675.1 heme-binding domain-containing protein [Lutibacter sp.]
MKRLLLIILALFILIQFIKIEKNDSKSEMNAISTVMEIPVEVNKIIQTSCADCHSNSTKYPWYSEIAPASWFLAQHIKEGKEKLNFSEWTTYNKDQKQHIIKDLKEVLNEREMPLKSYVLVHKELGLSENQYQILYDWVNTIQVE